MKNTSDLEELILTTDSNGDVKPEFMEGVVSEAALRMGIVEKREFRTKEMVSTWLRLTETGNLIKARLSTLTPLIQSIHVEQPRLRRSHDGRGISRVCP